MEQYVPMAVFWGFFKNTFSPAPIPLYFFKIRSLQISHRLAEIWANFGFLVQIL